MGRKLIMAASLLVALLALAACAAKETAPAAPAAPEPAAKPAWQEEWERVLEAAKAEGRVAVVGPLGDAFRQALTEPFEKKYGIKVEYLGVRGPEFTGRLRTERTAGQYLWDLVIGGVTHWVPYLDAGYLEPLEPALILPEVKDPKNWWGSKLLWLDKEHRLLQVALTTANTVTVNSRLVKPEEIKSYKDLLNPQWKGKIMAEDPRTPGSGLSQFTFFYQHKDLGADFIRGLVKQDLTLTRDPRQALEWLGLGRYPIMIGAYRFIALPMQKEGVPIKDLDPRGIKEGGQMGGGVSSLTLINRAPHPNAAKVYINWFLAKEGQDSFAPAAGEASLRLDASRGHLEPWQLPQEGYVHNYTLEAHAARGKTVELMQELLGR